MASEQTRGFSLLETVVALVILAMALGALFEAYGNGLRAVDAGNRHGEARLVAQSLLAEIGEPVEPGSRKGVRGGFGWEVAVTPSPAAALAPPNGAAWRLYDVSVTVRWAPGRRIRLETIRFGANS